MIPGFFHTRCPNSRTPRPPPPGRPPPLQWPGAACGATQLLHCATALLVLQPERQGQDCPDERLLRRG